MATTCIAKMDDGLCLRAQTAETKPVTGGKAKKTDKATIRATNLFLHLAVQIGQLEMTITDHQIPDSKRRKAGSRSNPIHRVQLAGLVQLNVLVCGLTRMFLQHTYLYMKPEP